MTKTKAILALTFLLVFAAGAVVGMVRQRAFVGAHHPPDRGSFLTKELGLTPDQQDKMRQIWSELGPGRGGDRDHWDRRREYQKERDDAIQALLTPEQKVRYDAVRKHYDERVAELGKERTLAFQRAVEQTKSILTPEQAAKYESFLNKRREGMGPGPGPGPGPGGPGDHIIIRRERRDGPPTRPS
jgi:Spy/CpxP family protein refolding chaperone